ncbi:PAS domain-containing sensor histidine kinase [Myxococcus stipitatus]|uniref:PAS domain-containing sensor histidine kinase n=1 Tax=Myxococcus stipitatus TaxID=83455 RepID=UPI001F2E8E68|nr:PAS domain-containing sensor histidine kinase [Myxococcus stipitatus]MCE9669830.1 PAS domain-containing sensor histidine kinase [Myxococcus stipitatus]
MGRPLDKNIDSTPGSGVTYATGRGSDEATLDTAAQLRLLIDSVRDYAIFTLDVTGRIASWNAGAERIKGYRAEEILGQHFSRFYPPEDVAWGKPQWELEVASREGRFEDEGWRVRKDGSRFWANVIITALRDGSGRLVGFGKVTRDFTERKRAEEVREMERLREALQARDEFLSVASHELKTPLTSLQLKINSLLRLAEGAPEAGVPGARLTKDLELARRQVRKLTDLIEDLLDVSRISAGKLTLAPAPMDLAALVQEVVARNAPLATQAGCRVELDVVSPVMGRWDRQRLDQVVTNLLTNALKYGAGMPVFVRLRVEESHVVLSVRDEGIGIAPEDLPRIFERFERAVSERRYHGLGLGLFITQQVVLAHGGTVEARSVPDQGSTFTVRLPMSAPSPGSLPGPLSIS